MALPADTIISPVELVAGTRAVIIDCRFSLADSAAGRKQYSAGHIPGAFYLSLDADLSGPVEVHGGRHPLPGPALFAARLAELGVDQDADVVAYDDSRFAFAARLWWMMKSLGYRPPRLLDGGYQGFLAAGGVPDKEVPVAAPCPAPEVTGFTAVCDREGLRAAQGRGAILVDSREEARYAGREEPIDPVAGHIPGAINRPWQEVSNEAGEMLDIAALQTLWGDEAQADDLVVYCGSGVTACVNLLSLHLLGVDEAVLYAGSWSDWCSYL